MSASVKILGLPGLRTKLRGLMLSDAERVRVIEAAAIPVESEAKRNAPVLSGTLRRDIHTEARATATGAVAEIGNSTNVPYAARREFGFSGVDSLGRNYNDAATPYLRPALKSQRANSRKAAAAAIKALLAKGAA